MGIESEFIIWNVSFDKKKDSINFWICQVGFRYLNQGDLATFKFILDELGFHNLEIEDWTIRPFMTDYLEEQNYKDWEDIWSLNWEVKLSVHRPKNYDFPTSKSHYGEIANLESLIRIRLENTSDQPDRSLAISRKCTLLMDFPEHPKNATAFIKYCQHFIGVYQEEGKISTLDESPLMVEKPFLDVGDITEALDEYGQLDRNGDGLYFICYPNIGRVMICLTDLPLEYYKQEDPIKIIDWLHSIGMYFGGIRTLHELAKIQQRPIYPFYTIL